MQIFGSHRRRTEARSGERCNPVGLGSGCAAVAPAPARCPRRADGGGVAAELPQRGWPLRLGSGRTPHAAPTFGMATSSRFPFGSLRSRWSRRCWPGVGSVSVTYLPSPLQRLAGRSWRWPRRSSCAGSRSSGAEGGQDADDGDHQNPDAVKPASWPPRWFGGLNSKESWWW